MHRIVRRTSHVGLLLMAFTLLVGGCKKKVEVETGENSEIGPGYHVIEVKNGGELTGVVSFSGDRAANSIEVQKDQDACGTGHANPSVPGSGTGLGGAIVYLDGIAEGKSFDEISLEGKLDQKSCDYIPHTQLMRAPAKLLVSNSDPALHNTNFKQHGTQISNEAEPPGVPPREVEFATPGLVDVTCDVHPWMRGFIMVAKHPYYAITDANGIYHLTSVPPGKYTLKVWRDNWKLDQPKDAAGHITAYKWGADLEKSSAVTVAQGVTQTVDFVFP
jgi:hypothetical protein